MKQKQRKRGKDSSGTIIQKEKKASNQQYGKFAEARLIDVNENLSRKRQIINAALSLN